MDGDLQMPVKVKEKKRSHKKLDKHISVPIEAFVKNVESDVEGIAKVIDIGNLLFTNFYLTCRVCMYVSVG